MFYVENAFKADRTRFARCLRLREGVTNKHLEYLLAVFYVRDIAN